MPDLPPRQAPPLGVILWPAFVSAMLASLAFFAFFDPSDLARLLGIARPVSRLAGYSAGFLLAWVVTALSSALTWLLLRPAPRPPASLDEEDGT